MKVLISSVEKAVAKNGSEYFRVQIININKQMMNVVYFKPPNVEIAGKVCEVKLELPSNPAHSSKITNLEVLNDDITPYLKVTSIDVDNAMAYFKEKTSGLGDMTTIVNEIVFSRPPLTDRFKSWPAAKGKHHAFNGGLIEHTYSMAKIAEFLIKEDPAYKGLDESLVITAVLLHDFAKIIEYDWESPGPASVTVPGTLLGHICMVDEMIVKACVAHKIQTRKGKIIHLRHCILAHHGSKDWGSPVTPATREALLVHRLDMIQSRGQMALEAMEVLKPGQSAFNATLETFLINLEEENS